MASTTRRPRKPAKNDGVSTKTTSSSASPPSPSRIDAFFASAPAVYGAAIALRAVLLVYGLWQDAHSPVKYTDIDYLVFTDAARFVRQGAPDAGSPYARETYRYTPLLAWLLLPTAAPGAGALPFAWGKVLFAAADLVAGCFLERVVRSTVAGASSSSSSSTARAASARKYAAVWLLNPMVAAISTRGSAEGLLGALVAALLWAAQVARRPALAGVLLGAGVHLKIYPFVFAPALFWWMDSESVPPKGRTQPAGVLAFLTPARLQLTAASLGTFAGLDALMFSM